MMINIDGQVRKIESKSDSKVFFDFEFWAESDEDTYGLLCLIQYSDPTNIFLVKMNMQELAIHSDVQSMEIVKSRVVKETGVNDLVFPKVIRFDGNENDTSEGFQQFLKTYKEPIPVYESIFKQSEEAIQVGKLSIDEFNQLGGKIHLVGDIRI